MPRRDMAGPSKDAVGEPADTEVEANVDPAAAGDPPAAAGRMAELSTPLGPDGRSRTVEVALAPREALVGVRVERERQVYVTDHGRELAVDAAGEVTVREVDG